MFKPYLFGYAKNVKPCSHAHTRSHFWFIVYTIILMSRFVETHAHTHIIIYH